MVGNDLYIVRDSLHQIYIKISIEKGRLVEGNKRGRVKVIGDTKSTITMSIGTYKVPIEKLRMKIPESVLFGMINNVK